MTYRAPVADHQFILRSILPVSRLVGHPRFADSAPETVDAILTEAGRLCEEVLAPLNVAGDRNPARLVDGKLHSPPGFAQGFQAIAEGGWVGLAAAPEFGGMGLPQLVAQAVGEMMAGANLALQLNPMLSQGQIIALEHHADPWMQALYLPRLISGQWSGTMNLTEPQAGSDVGALQTRAAPNPDGSHAITGQKIFITWGDTDFTENTCHLVLARLPDAPAGTRGISMFMVPKFVPDTDGRPGKPNNLRVVSLEHKLGIHGCPTCVMAFEGATGWLVGPSHRGMAAMFTMMNEARLSVGMQGVGVAEAALQKAAAYAADRVQFGPIIRHPDIRRMLAGARAEVFAARCIGLACAMASDLAVATGDPDPAARAAFLTPIAKTYGTDIGCRVADAAVQVHGGMGYIEETGAAQYLRDARITPIYEGTNGIQAVDLVGRKLADDGKAAFALLDDMADGAREARDRLPGLADAVNTAIEDLSTATAEFLSRDPSDRLAGAMPYLSGFARVLGAHFHLSAALADPAREALARIHITRILPHLAGDLAEAAADPADLDAVDDADFG